MINVVSVVVLATLLFTPWHGTDALVPSQRSARIWGRQLIHDKQSFMTRSLSVDSEDDVAVSVADCGCGTPAATNTIYSGKPPNKARTIDPRQVIATKPIYTVNGDPTNMDELIGTSGTSIVVFLRSLG